MGQHVRPAAASGDRLDRVAEMLCDAVDLLNRAMEEIKGEREDDDGDAARPPDRKPQQPR